MEELLNLISNFGVTIILVALFVWEWIAIRKDMKSSLEQMAQANINTAESLSLLRKSMENQEKILIEHDKRSIEIMSEIKRRDGK